MLNILYRLDEQIGWGGMGEIYRAHETLLERNVAVMLIAKAGLSVESRARLLAKRIAKFLSTLRTNWPSAREGQGSEAR